MRKKKLNKLLKGHAKIMSNLQYLKRLGVDPFHKSHAANVMQQGNKVYYVLLRANKSGGISPQRFLI